MIIVTFTIIFQQRRTLLFGHLCLMVQANFKRRSNNTFPDGFSFFFKGNLRSRVCNCDFNCSSASIFPSASLDPLVTLNPLSLTHPCRISHANSLVSSVPSALLTWLFIPSIASVWSSPQQFSNAIQVCFLPSQHLSTWRSPSTATRLNQRKWPKNWFLVFRKNEKQKQKSFFQPFTALLFPPIFLSPAPKSIYVWLLHHHMYSKPLGHERKTRCMKMEFYHCCLHFAESDSSKRKAAVGITYRHQGEALWKPGNLRICNSFHPIDWKEDSTNITEVRHGSWSLSWVFLRVVQVWESTQG